MKTNNHKIWSVALTMMLGILMVACSEDEIQDVKMSRELHLVMGTQNITDVTNLTDGTRALPTNYQTYSAFYGSILPTNKSILGFLTTADAEPIQSQFAFSTDNTNSTPVHSWSSPLKIDTPSSTDYYLYGFMPSEAAPGVNAVTIAHLPSSTNYAEGAVLTINGINAVTSNDVCVIVGVKDYELEENKTETDLPAITDYVLDMDARLGKFDLTLPGKEKNYAYLLVDHIFRSLKFSLKIDEQYGKLRTIKVKKMELTASTDGITQTDQIVNTVNATITLRPTNGTSPLDNVSGSIVVAASQTGSSPDPAMLYDESEHKDVNNKNVPLTLTTTAQDLRAYLAPIAITPATIQRFVLKTTYDVYDRKGNLIRAGETAENTFSLPASTLNDLKSGEEYTFKIEVIPTYLYMLSEPDLNSPNFIIN